MGSFGCNEFAPEIAVAAGGLARVRVRIWVKVGSGKGLGAVLLVGVWDRLRRGQA